MSGMNDMKVLVEALKLSGVNYVKAQAEMDQAIAHFREFTLNNPAAMCVLLYELFQMCENPNPLAIGMWAARQPEKKLQTLMEAALTTLTTVVISAVEVFGEENQSPQ